MRRRSSLAWLGVGDFSAKCCTVCGHRCINGVICAKCGGDPMNAGDHACIFCERAFDRWHRLDLAYIRHAPEEIR